MVMGIYSIAIILSCGILSSVMLLLVRPVWKLLYASTQDAPPYARIVVWVALGFLQVVGFPFHAWCAATVASLIGNRLWRDTLSGEVWWLIFGVFALAALAVLALQLPFYLAVELGILAAAALAPALLQHARYPLPVDMASVQALAICFGVVAYSASV